MPEKNEAKDDGLKTPDQWARLTGNVIMPKKIPGKTGTIGQIRFSPAHLAATTLHGWREHAHHTAAPMLLTEKDYISALKAALAYPACDPHRQAVSKHSGQKCAARRRDKPPSQAKKGS